MAKTIIGVTEVTLVGSVKIQRLQLLSKCTGRLGMGITQLRDNNPICHHSVRPEGECRLESCREAHLSRESLCEVCFEERRACLMRLMVSRPGLELGRCDKGRSRCQSHSVNGTLAYMVPSLEVLVLVS